MSKARGEGSSGSVDIWSKLDREPRDTEANLEQDGKSFNSSIVFVGDLGCGKSTLIQTFLKPSASKDTKPTIALEFNYARKSTNGVKSVANLWEIGGDLVEPKLLEIPLTVKTLTTAAVVVCCDLSKPHNVLNSVLRSISAVKEIVGKRISELQASNVTAVSEIRDNIANSYKGHPDVARLRPLDVPVLLIANKHDQFRALPASDRRLVINVLRFVAHYFGATLLTMSSSDAGMRDAYRQLLSCVGFGLPAKAACETNPDKMVYITRGRDSFHSIMLGATPGSAGGEAEAAGSKSKGQQGLVASEVEMDQFLTHKGVTRDCWGRLTDLMAGIFGEADPLPGAGAGEGKEGGELDSGEPGDGTAGGGHPEAEVDDMRAVRDAALVRYVQENERRAEMQAKMNARSSS